MISPIITRFSQHSPDPPGGTLQVVAEALSFADATTLLEDVRRGYGAIDAALAEKPLLVVNLDESEERLRAADSLNPPSGWPVVIVGIMSGARAAPSGVPGLDILLTDRPNPPAPWVHAMDGLDKALLELDDVVSARPQACTTLVQVLRSSEHSDVDSALLIESLGYASLQGGAEHASWIDRLDRPARDRDATSTVLVERNGPVLRIVLDRPSRRNAYSARMRDELIDALRLAAADDSLTRIVLQGNGPNFSSGGDLAEFGTVADTATAHSIRMQRNAGWWVHQVANKTVVRVHGACVGAGVELPAFARTVSASPDTTFTLPEVMMGLIPGAGGTASIPRRIGRQRTGWLALSGRTIDAQVACEWGLVDEVSASDR